VSEKNSSFANFGRESDCTVCKCAVLCMSCSYFLSFCSKIIDVIVIFTLVPNVFAYEQWRSSRRSLVQIHWQLNEAQTIALPKARHCLYAVLGAGNISIFLFYKHYNMYHILLKHHTKLMNRHFESLYSKYYVQKHYYHF
jgi:hypothetical protein